MKQRILLAALCTVAAVGLFGCNGSDTGTGFSGMEVALSGQYLVASKDPGILPGLYSLQLFQNGKSLEGIDNLGRTWTGTVSNLTFYGVFPAGGDQQQQQQQQQPGQPGQIPGQQQQPQQPESYHGEIYLTTQTKSGTISLTGVIETSAELQLGTTTGQQQQQQQQTTGQERTVIAATIVDERGRAGNIVLYNLYYTQPTTTQQP